MNTVIVNLDVLSTNQLERLADELFDAVNRRRSSATLNDGIISDAELIARLMGQPLMNAAAPSANKRDGYLYQDANYSIRVDVYGNAQTLTYQGREVWNLATKVFQPDAAWMVWIRTTAQALRDQQSRERDAELRQKLVTSLHDALRGTEFTSVVEALEHFQLGSFKQPDPQSEEQTKTASTERLPSADDIRRDILMAGLVSTVDPVIREMTLRLIRKQLRDIHYYDKVLCEAVLARMSDPQEGEQVRREAVATAWQWLDAYANRQAVTAAFFDLMGKGGAEACLVMEGMALLGKTDEPDCEFEE